MAKAVLRFVYPPWLIVIHETVRMMLGYRPDATKQVPAIRAILLVVVMRIMYPTAVVDMAKKRTGPLLLSRSEMKHTERRVTVANA